MDPEQEWHQIVETLLQPLRAEGSEFFVQNVMRKVRHVAPREARLLWRSFTRWAFPALGLSMTSFALACVLTMRSAPISTDVLFLGDEQTVSTDWASHSLNEDPLLDSSTGVNP